MDTTDQLGLNSDDSLGIWRVGPDSFQMFWPSVESILSEHPGGLLNFISIDTVKELIQEGKLDLWIGLVNNEICLAGLTQFQGSVEKYLEVLWTGGSHFNQLKGLAIDKLEKWGALHGADKIVLGGRLGLIRSMRSIGFEFHRIEVSKPLRYVRTDSGDLAWRN